MLLSDFSLVHDQNPYVLIVIGRLVVMQAVQLLSFIQVREREETKLVAQRIFLGFLKKKLWGNDPN